MHKVLFTILVSLVIVSCGNSNEEKPLTTVAPQPPVDTVTQTPIESTAENNTSIGTAKFKQFNNIDQARRSLSGVGIGELSGWKDDEMGGYMSITTYYQFGGGTPENNLAYYLTSESSDNIQKLELILNINNGGRLDALHEFSNTIAKTYEALGIRANARVIAAAKAGKQLKSSNETYTESLKLDKSKIETWKFVVETK